jgi:hypothetical protein
METNNPSKKHLIKEEKDEILGRALSKTIKSDAIADQCPPLEDLSAFIDDTLDEQGRDAILGHLAHCDKCYEVVSIAREMAGEEKKQKLMTKSWYYAPIAIAAAAVLAIVFKFVIQTPTPYSPPSSAQMIATLTKSTDAKSLSNSIRDERVVSHTVSYGFGARIALEKISFKIGVCLTDLDISLMAEDKTKSFQVIKGMIATLQPLEGAREVISVYDGISKKLEEGSSPAEFLGKADKIEQFFRDKGVLLYLKFGEWTEGGRIGALTKNREFFDVRPANYFIDNLRGKDLPQGLFTSLNEIKGIISKGDMTERDFKAVETAFNNILDVM